VGQTIGSFEVIAITDDWSGLNPIVWLKDGREICRVALDGNELREKRSRKYQRKQARKKKREKKRRKRRKKRRKR
jgi:transposase